MTCIVGLIHDDVVYIGGDSAGGQMNTPTGDFIPYCPECGGQHWGSCPTVPAQYWFSASRQPVVQYGWVCPKCGSVWAPFVADCENCRPLTISKSTITMQGNDGYTAILPTDDSVPESCKVTHGDD